MTRTIQRSELASIRAVCIGGGTGVPASIKALMTLGIDPDAVVTVADDGGSSGKLRNHTGQIPPGDLRKCLVALAQDQQNPWVNAFRKRFEYANDHTLGNLVLTALQETTGTLRESIALCEQLLQTRGHVYPASLENVLLTGTTQDGQRLVGQSVICKSETALEHVALEPSDPSANPDAIDAILRADIIVFGPGSLFTSIIPNLLIPDICKAIHQSKAATVFICSLADVQGETWGLNAAELIKALEIHGLEGRLDYAIANNESDAKHSGNVTGYFAALGADGQPLVAPESERNRATRPVTINEDIVSAIRERGIKVLVRELNDPHRPSWHDPQELAKALASVVADSKGL